MANELPTVSAHESPAGKLATALERGLHMLASSALASSAPLALLIGGFANHALEMEWAIAWATFCGLQYLLSESREGPPGDAQSWRRADGLALGATVLAGALWSVPAAHAMSAAPVSQQLIVFASLVTVGMAAMLAYGSRTLLAACFHLAIVLPVIAFGVARTRADDAVLILLAGSYVVAGVSMSMRWRGMGKRTQALLGDNTALRVRVDEQERAVERGEQAKTHFLAATSHDLRQPVQALSLYLGVLKEQPLSEKSRYLVENISAAVSTLGSLFDTLLYVSRLDAGFVKPSPTFFAGDVLFDEITQEYATMAASRGLILRARPRAPRLFSDRELVARILRNFVDNAVRHTQDGWVLLAWRRIGGHVRIEVWDTGPGIAESERERVFWEFYQLSNPERDRSKGLGLGLPIAQRIATLLGHELSLRSAPWNGSVFALEIPVEPVAGQLT